MHTLNDSLQMIATGLQLQGKLGSKKYHNIEGQCCVIGFLMTPQQATDCDHYNKTASSSQVKDALVFNGHKPLVDASARVDDEIYDILVTGLLQDWHDIIVERTRVRQKITEEQGFSEVARYLEKVAQAAGCTLEAYYGA
jgi:hypothetical protein